MPKKQGTPDMSRTIVMPTAPPSCSGAAIGSMSSQRANCVKEVRVWRQFFQLAPWNDAIWLGHSPVRLPQCGYLAGQLMMRLLEHALRPRLCEFPKVLGDGHEKIWTFPALVESV